MKWLLCPQNHFVPAQRGFLYLLQILCHITFFLLKDLSNHAHMHNEVFITYNITVSKKGYIAIFKRINTHFVSLALCVFAGLECQRGAFKANGFLEIESVSYFWSLWHCDQY